MPTLAEINASIEQHQQALAGLQCEAEALRNSERSKVIDEVREKIAEFGLTASDLRLQVRAGQRRATAGSASRPKTAAKYRGPNGEEWSGGRGRKPAWVTSLLAAGQSLSDYAV